MFKAKEDSAHCGRQCCPRQRGLKLNVYDTKDGSLAMVAPKLYPVQATGIGWTMALEAQREVS